MAVGGAELADKRVHVVIRLPRQPNPLLALVLRDGLLLLHLAEPGVSAPIANLFDELVHALDEVHYSLPGYRLDEAMAWRSSYPRVSICALVVSASRMPMNARSPPHFLQEPTFVPEPGDGTSQW